VHRGVHLEAVRRHPAGRPILAPRRSIQRDHQDQIFEHYQARYTPEHWWWPRRATWTTDTVVETGQERPSARPWSGPPSPPRPAAGDQQGPAGRDGYHGWSPAASSRPTWCSAARRGPHDERRFALGVLNAAFGGACPPAVPGGAGEAGPGPTRCTASPPAADHRHVGHLRRLLARKADECWPSAPRRIDRVVSRRLTDRRAHPRQGPGAPARSSQPGGPVLADEQARQVRAGLPAARAGRRGARRDRGRRARRHPRDRVRGPHPTKTLAVVGPFDDASAFQI